MIASLDMMDVCSKEVIYAFLSVICVN